MRKGREIDAWSSGVALVLAMQSSSCANIVRSDFDMLRKEEQSKPWMVLRADGSALAIDMSIAHDEGVVACVTSTDVPIGIDTLSVSRAAASFASEGGMAVLSRRVPAWMVDWVRQHEQQSESAGTKGSQAGRLGPGMAYASAWTLLEALAKARGVSLYSTITRADMFSAQLLDMGEAGRKDGGATTASLDLRTIPFDPAAPVFHPDPSTSSKGWVWPPAATATPYRLLLSWSSGQNGIHASAWSAQTLYLPSVDQVMTVVVLDGLRGHPTGWRTALDAPS